jgi:hypothetical protein
MSKNKTVETDADVTRFVNSIDIPQKIEDSIKIIELMEAITGHKAKMWGTSIIGFGSYHYVYESGREGDAPQIGFSPRKAKFALYLGSEFPERESLLESFGKYKSGASCLYFNKLSDVNLEVLKKLCENSLAHVRERWECN